MKQRLFWIVAATVIMGLLYAWQAGYSVFASTPLLLRHLNRLFAILGFFFFFLQIVLSSRSKLVEKGFGLDKMIRQHRQVGRIALGLLILHPIFYFLFQGEIVINTIFRVIGLVVLLGLTITATVASLHRKLKLPYELWLQIHKVNYVLFPLVFVHVFHNADPGSPLFYFWAAFAALFAFILIHKVWLEISIRKHPYEVVKVQREAQGVHSLYFKGRPLAYQPGQFMYLRLLRNGKLSSAHPFTISSSPTWDQVAVTPKELGDFTATIADTKPGDKALIDAPYGTFSFLHYNCQKLMFIAGGIGITPYMSMLRYMYDEKIQIPTVLLWGNKSEDELCFRDELAKMEQEMEHLHTVFIMSRQKDWEGEKGRVDREMIEKYTAGNADAYDFFVCGPPPMSKATIAALHEMGVARQKIHHELFEF